MENNTAKPNPITVQTTVNIPVEKAWQIWTEPEHITKWNNASDDWHTPYAENDLRVGGTFLSRMEARDGSASFDLVGTYDEVTEFRSIKYTMSDGRKVSVVFEAGSDVGEAAAATTKVIETFDPENENPAEMQRAGWQAILDNFKKYAESN
jgi:uncharacterized protein YndB with AHSA1/START domain